jgi:hypothetical protein
LASTQISYDSEIPGKPEGHSKFEIAARCLAWEAAGNWVSINITEVRVLFVCQIIKSGLLRLLLVEMEPFSSAVFATKDE